jgi:hypothetical protein
MPRHSDAGSASQGRVPKDPLWRLPFALALPLLYVVIPNPARAVCAMAVRDLLLLCFDFALLFAFALRCHPEPSAPSARWR